MCNEINKKFNTSAFEILSKEIKLKAKKYQMI